MSVVLEIEPVPKPRLTRQGRFNKTAKRYYAYCEDLRWLATQAGFSPGNTLSLTFVLPMPNSWSGKKKQRMNDAPHQQRPDLDNLIKAFQDALYADDAEVYEYGTMRKVWGETGHIVIHEY